MIYSTATVPVNPEDEPTLSHAQVWQGLVLKARDARLFLPPGVCTRCDVVAEGDGFLVRDATIGGTDLREIVQFEEGRKVTFFQASGPREGAIINELFEDSEGALLLRFYCLIGMRYFAPASEEEKAEQANFDSENGYRRALLSTLKRAREMVADGTI